MATKTKKGRAKSDKNKKTKRRITTSSVNKRRTKPSVFPEVIEALKEVDLMLQGKLPMIDAKEWIKTL